MLYYAKQNIWKKGTVVKGYKYQEGYVSFYLDDEPVPKYDYMKTIDNSKDEQQFVKEIGKVAHSRGVGNCVPIIMRTDEYLHFALNKNKWTKWKNMALLKIYNGELIEIKTAPEVC